MWRDVRPGRVPGGLPSHKPARKRMRATGKTANEPGRGAPLRGPPVRTPSLSGHPRISSRAPPRRADIQQAPFKTRVPVARRGRFFSHFTRVRRGVRRSPPCAHSAANGARLTSKLPRELTVVDMAAQNVRGVSRVLEKLENSIKDGNFYEAHQMYRTIYFRYLSQRKYSELLDMLYKGAILFLDHNQQTSGADLAILLVDVLVKSEDTNYAEWTPKLCKIFAKISTTYPERETFITSAIRWSAKGGMQGHPLLHQGIAQVYWNEKNYTNARHHYMYSKDGQGCAKLLIEFQSTRGYTSEIDLFITQAVLQFLCLRNQATASQTFNNYTKEHPRIRRAGPPYLLPLLNFIWFLLQAVESRKLSTFTVLCEQYEPSIKRDPCYIQYLDKIGQIFFGVKPPPQQPSGGFFGNFLHSFLNGLDDDSDEDIAQASTSTLRLLQDNTELD